MPYTQAENDLLSEVRGFLRRRAGNVLAMAALPRQLGARLAATQAFRKVHGRDAAERDAIWDVESGLDICLERALEEVVETILRCARLAGRRRSE